MFELSWCISSMVVRAKSTRAERPGRLRPAHLLRRHILRTGTLAVLSVIGLFVTISPTTHSVLDADMRVAQIPSETIPAPASLTYSGTDPVITGSVNVLFQTALFVGPTSGLKTDRLRANVDLLDFSRSFLQERQRIAALNSGPAEPAVPQSHIGVPVPGTLREVVSPVSVASIDPSPASSALSAIEDATPVDPDIPLPIFASEQLAYSRQNTPTTEKVTGRYSEREQWCMATAIYFEARGESYRGQVGVAQVVMNRVKHRLYPNTICGVVFQNQNWRNRCQFSFACDGIPETVTDRTAWAQAREITRKVTRGTLYLSEVANATHYHASYVYPGWATRMKRVARVGRHIFYRFRHG